MLSDSFSALATGGPGSGHSRNPGPYLNVTLLYRWTTLPQDRLATTPIAGVKAGRRPPVGLGLDAGGDPSPTIATRPPERSGGGPICRPEARNHHRTFLAQHARSGRPCRPQVG